MKCKALACETGASIRGYCAKDYLRRRRHGHYGRVDGTPVREHIARLRTHGWTLSQIDQEAGVRVAGYIASGRTTNVLGETAAKILALPVAARLLHYPAVGFRRRVEALACMGWSQQALAELSGLSVSSISHGLKKDTVAAVVFVKLRDVYARYETAQGQSRLSASRATTAGFQPPMAWEYADIDDPKAKPFQGFKEAA